jgi:hypothetical protein
MLSLRRSRAVPAVMAVMALGLLAFDSGFREDEVQCEHAAVQLDLCCPELPRGTVPCAHADGCFGPGIMPTLTIEESRCVRSQSCDYLRREVCDRVAQRVTTIEQSQLVSSFSEEPEGVDVHDLPAVCP